MKELEQSQANHFRGYVISLIGLVLMGTGVLYWVYLYTDFLPLIGGLLSFGGILVWVAFLSNLIREERKKQMQESFERLLLSKYGWMSMILTVTAFVSYAGCHGSIIIESAGDEADRAVQIHRSTVDGGVTFDESHHLPPHAQKKFLVETPWFGSADYRVKVSGLPTLVAHVGGFRWQTLVVPNSLLMQPVIFFRPSPIVSSTSAGEPKTLTVEVDSQEVGRISMYKGETVWVGCDQDVTIPQYLQDGWRLQTALHTAPEIVLLRWQRPRAVAADRRFATGELVRFRILNSDGSIWVTKSEIIRPSSRPEDFPQEVTIDVPH